MMGSSLLPAAAHDFWIEPDTFEIASDASLSVSARVGHGADQSAWPSLPHRIVGLRSLGPDGLRDHQSGLSAGGTGTFKLPPLSEGVHVVFLESTNSFSELAAAPFADYVEAEGITPIARHRAATESTEEPGRELYSRRGKTLVKVGATPGSQAHVTSPLGLTLEITPRENPFTHTPGAPFAVSVLYRGRPVEGATLHITQLDQPEISMQARTGADGLAQVETLSSGTWLFHTVWAEPADGLLNSADYSTVFSSLTFRID
jgi:uncharacterized GH25 family protein